MAVGRSHAEDASRPVIAVALFFMISAMTIIGSLQLSNTSQWAPYQRWPVAMTLLTLHIICGVVAWLHTHTRSVVLMNIVMGVMVCVTFVPILVLQAYELHHCLSGVDLAPGTIGFDNPNHVSGVCPSVAYTGIVHMMCIALIYGGAIMLSIVQYNVLPHMKSA